MSEDDTSGRNIEVNGVSLYVEEYGEGHHWSSSTVGRAHRRCGSRSVPLLAEHFRVITPDTRGHGQLNEP